MERKQWINIHYPAARMVTAGTGIFPETLLSQAILESSAKDKNGVYRVGASQLASRANNYFGIKKGTGWKGKTIDLPTLEYYAGKPVTVIQTFRAYPTTADSFRDYVNFLKSNPRYTKAGVFTATTPEEQADALQKAGYATDPKYASILKGIMKGIKKIMPPPNIALTAAALILFFLLINKNK